MTKSLKQKFLNVIWPNGKKAKILRGPLKGYYFQITANSGWSPIVGRWEPESQELFVEVISKGDIAYDLGANNGIHTLLLSRLVGPTGKVFAFEPLLTNCEEIKINTDLNSIKNVHVINAAVGGESGKMKFHLGLHDKQGSLVGIGRESGETIEVDIISLDDFIEKGNPAPRFIKIDIEGAESLALAGFEKSIDKYKPILFIELHTPEQDSKVGQLLLKHNYIAYRIRDNYRDETLRIPGIEKIKNLSLPHPHKDGIWGTILAIHPTTVEEINGK